MALLLTQEGPRLVEGMVEREEGERGQDAAHRSFIQLLFRHLGGELMHLERQDIADLWRWAWAK